MKKQQEAIHKNETSSGKHLIRLKMFDKALVFVIIAVLVTQPLCSCETSSPEIVVNEVMFNPFGDDEGNEWLELYNKAEVSQDLKGWSISNREGSVAVELPAWDLPGSAYLVVWFGGGTNDQDFQDGSGTFYTGVNVAIFDNTEDEIALYRGAPSSKTIVDFVSWCSDNDYNQGTAHEYAVDGDIWSSRKYFDIGFPEGKPIFGGHSIGRDRNSTDTNSPMDWDRHGGSDAYYPTLGNRNTGPLFSTKDGIKLTQLKANLLLIHWGYRVTHSSHEVLEESQSEDETYVKARHSFETNLGDTISETFIGIGEYHWKKSGSHTWIEEIRFILSTSDLSESFSLNYSREWTGMNLTEIINEDVIGTYTCETFMTDSVYSDDEDISDRPIQIFEELYSSESTLTVTQVDLDRFHTEITGETNDRDLVWKTFFTKESQILSDTEFEASTELIKTNNIEGDIEISTHYNVTLGTDGWFGEEGIGMMETRYDEYTLTIEGKTYSLSDPGYFRINREHEGYYGITWDMDLVDELGEPLDLNTSGYLEILSIDDEFIYKGKLTTEESSKVFQFYIDGTEGVIAGSVTCSIGGGILALGVCNSWWPGGWIAIVVGAIIAGACALLGLAVESDRDPPRISFEAASGCDRDGGWAEVKIIVRDDSDFSMVKIRIINADTTEKIFVRTWEDKSSPFEFLHRVPNQAYVPFTLRVDVWAIDNSASKNRETDFRPLKVPGKRLFVVETNPKNEEENVSVDKGIEIKFCKATNTSSVEGAITINPDIEYSVSWSADKTTITLTPSSDLDHDTKYTVKIHTTAMCQWGSNLAEPYAFSFTTKAEGPDLTITGVTLIKGGIYSQPIAVHPNETVEDVYAGEPVTFNATIKNNGNISAEGFTVKLEIYKWTTIAGESTEPDIWRESDVMSLNAKESSEVSFTHIIFPSPGLYTVTIKVDPHGDVTESVVENNEFSFSVRVKAKPYLNDVYSAYNLQRDNVVEMYVRVVNDDYSGKVYGIEIFPDAQQPPWKSIEVIEVPAGWSYEIIGNGVRFYTNTNPLIKCQRVRFIFRVFAIRISWFIRLHITDEHNENLGETVCARRELFYM